MGVGIAKVDEQAVTERLGDMSIVALDNFGTNLLKGPDYVSVLFGIELAGQFGRVHQIAKHDGQLATFSVWGVRFCCRDCRPGSRVLLWRTWCERLTAQGRTTGTAE